MPQVDSELVRTIAYYGEVYKGRFLSDVDCEALRRDWYEALKFFFSKAFFQGRTDEVSNRFFRNTVEFLNRLMKWQRDFQLLKKYEWERLEELLKNENKAGDKKRKFGKDRDIRMVIDTLKFIDQLDDKNIVNYSLNKIDRGELDELWNSLRQNITQVGPKIASFYLRDLVSLFGLESKISIDEQIMYLFPIDTWVRKICIKVGIASSGMKDREIRDRMITLCRNKSIDVSPLKFNMGAWYLGKHALDVLLDEYLRR